MTRINCVPVEELSVKHLVAEYRELPRVFRLAREAIERGDKGNPPPDYVLGKGHVWFFYSRCGYLYKRQKQLYAEMVRRGYSPNFKPTRELLKGIPSSWRLDWVPTPRALALNRQRIIERTAPPK